ncbi:MAG: phosphatidylglycerophosphatase A [Spirochaetota bacterium]|nr:phosphatidylglycerophosphatase A [Spirochaetota bacterium]
MWWKRLLFTGLYTGYSPIASGTTGSLLALVIYVFEYLIFGDISWVLNVVIVLVMLYPSIRLGDAGEIYFGKEDPSEIVLDEIMGYWISVLFYPFSWKIAILAFLIFRFIDILKPYPLYKLQELKGGLGVMLDDYVAGILTNLLLLIIVIITHLMGISIY